MSEGAAFCDPPRQEGLQCIIEFHEKTPASLVDFGMKEHNAHHHGEGVTFIEKADAPMRSMRSPSHPLPRLILSVLPPPSVSCLLLPPRLRP
eukprot:8511970-Pyramimonas_sp.AAC.1